MGNAVLAPIQPLHILLPLPKGLRMPPASTFRSQHTNECEAKVGDLQEAAQFWQASPARAAVREEALTKQKWNLDTTILELHERYTVLEEEISHLAEEMKDAVEREAQRLLERTKTLGVLREATQVCPSLIILRFHIH